MGGAEFKAGCEKRAESPREIGIFGGSRGIHAPEKEHREEKRLQPLALPLYLLHCEINLAGNCP